MPTFFNNVFVDSSAYFMPGEAISNDDIDRYIAPLNKASSRIKRRVLAENGIKTRYYAINDRGNTVYSNVQLAENAINLALSKSSLNMEDVDLLATGTCGGDNLMPGFANMLQGEMSAPPMATYTSNGICMAGVSAMAHAASQIELGASRTAMVVGTDLPSRLFKSSRFSPQGYSTDFGAHFLRWMLSDGAGAMLLSNSSPRRDLQLKLRWVHQKSFSGDYPVCMQLGADKDGTRSFLDYPSCAEAEMAGAMALRQDIRLLPHLFDVAIHEYVELVMAGVMHPDRVDHFLCHYSSEKFMPVVEELMAQAELSIAKHKWYSNLAWRGNTGAASIFIMLAEFLETHELVAGEQILCFIPESGRFSVGFMMFEVVEPEEPNNPKGSHAPQSNLLPPDDSAEVSVAPPHSPSSSSGELASLLQELASIWHNYRSRAWRSNLIRKINQKTLTQDDYLRWMEHWIPQVREGSLWMREATANLSAPYDALVALMTQHADEEQFDFNILFNDYKLAGGSVSNIDDFKRNPGGEALNSFLHAYAAQENALGMLGSIYIIEGTGQRIIPALLPMLKAQLEIPADSFRFLEYHGENDENHLNRWLQAVKLVMSFDADVEREIVRTARRTAELYLMQLESVL